MEDLFEFFLGSLGMQTGTAIILGIGIIVWLRIDMRKQREWREKKEAKIDSLRRRIAKKAAEEKQNEESQ